MNEDTQYDNALDEEYYTFLNIPRNATPEEIINAYRRYSRLYHPDKHTDPTLKKEAEAAFNRVKQAYEVLSDPHRRAIYDNLGIRGLQIEGWEIVKRTKTPLEIKEEYERIQKEKQERLLQQRTNPKGNFTVNINATDLFSKYDDEYSDSSNVLSGIEISGMSLSQSIETPLSLRDTVTLHGQLSTRNGTGSGSINVTARRVVSPGAWFEVDIGAGNGPSLILKGFHALTKRLFCDAAAKFQYSAGELALTGVGTLTMPLDNHTVGHLIYTHGRNSLNIVVIRDTTQARFGFTICLGIFQSFVDLNYTYKMPEKQLKIRTDLRVGTFGGYLEYGAEHKVSQHSSLSVTVHVGVPTGVMLKVKLSRASQTYSFPISLSEEVIPASVFYATVVPIVGWTFVKKLIIDPIVKEQEKRDKSKQMELNRTKILEKQREAKLAVDLMKVTFSRIRAEEETKKGLVITKATYGQFVRSQMNDDKSETAHASDDKMIDVTIPLQCLVKDSKLVLHTGTKSHLPGFYDPCIGGEKQLLIQYLFHSQTHECIIKDDEPLRIPKQSHKVNTT